MAALEEVDPFGVLLGGRLHRADDGELIGDGGALGHELREVGAGDFGGNAFEGAAGGGSGLGVPGFELGRAAAEPEEDAVLLFALGDFGEGGRAKEPGPAHGGDGPGGESLEELAAVEVVVGRAAIWSGSRH